MACDKSRNQIQVAIKAGLVLVDEQIVLQSKYIVKENQEITYVDNSNTDNIKIWLANKIELDILLEDNDICIINKPLNLTMHPGTGTNNDTLANGLLYYDKNRYDLSRAGIVHRLDKNTSGCCVTGKTAIAMRELTQAIKDREVKRTYIALVNGVVDLPGKVEEPIARHPTRKVAMAVQADGRFALTYYRPLVIYPHHTLLEVSLSTGRTHQIRVHLSHIRNPIVGDKVYGHLQMPKGEYSPRARELIAGYAQQALHAIQLKFNHPVSNEEIVAQAPLPKTLYELLDSLTPTKILCRKWQDVLPNYKNTKA